MGGITLYRTFALYEEKKEFNVLRGKVPALGEYDINILAITVDGEKANTIPEPNNYVVNVDCQNGNGYWDYANWNAVITEINNQTKCNLHFETSSETNEWRTWIQKGGVTKYYTTLHNFLSDTEAVTQVFNSGDASSYLKENTSIVENIKNDSYYLPNALPEVGENADSRSELVNIILNSTGLTNKEKYDINLPFYIFKDGNSFLTFKNLQYQKFTSNITPVYGASYGSSIYLSLKSAPHSCTTNTFRSSETVNTANYSMTNIHYTGIVESDLGWAVGYTGKTATNDITIESAAVFSSNVNNTGWYSRNITNFTENKYVAVSVYGCSSVKVASSVSITIYEWYMY